MYHFLKILLSPFIYFFYNLKVEGKENIPCTGAAILAPNHRSNLDPLMVAVAVRRDIIFLAKEQLFQNKILKKFFESLELIPVKRDNNDIAALRAALRVLKKNKILGIFPEGTRVEEGQEQVAKEGIALLSSKSKSPIIPITIRANYKIFGKNKVIIHAPYILKEGMSYEEISREIMNIINEGVR